MTVIFCHLLLRLALVEHPGNQAVLEHYNTPKLLFNLCFLKTIPPKTSPPLGSPHWHPDLEYGRKSLPKRFQMETITVRAKWFLWIVGPPLLVCSCLY